MKRRVIAAALFATAITTPAHAMLDAERIAGLYCGTAISGGHLVEVRTRLTVGGDGLLQGTYDFADEGETTSGTLQESARTTENTRALTWFDKYGTGPVTMVFDETGMSFDGLWNTAPFEPALQWDGERCEDETV